ncbi:uncharacterized protein [Cardiocondyla obscurior]|uniref:uncharacterized protein n=1 Tax=Cardiocondyla obscurior TaxID=286306 RepID=UPI0039655D01
MLKTVPMETLSNAEREEYENATVCHVCESPFAVDKKRVRDYCHMTGRYRGPAHSKCNLQYRDTRYIPVVFHNLSGYDAHFVIKEITTAYEGKVDLLPITKEKYISLTKHVNDTAKGQDLRTAIKLRFIDSYKFLNASLDKLSSLLIKDKMRILRAEFAKLSEKNFDLLTRKGIFPYEYVNSVERLDESSLPSRKSFFSSLTGDTVSKTDYAHAETVWQQFSIQTLGEYSDLYLKTDVLLLADPLPYADFEWVDDEELANLEVDAIAVDSPTGYILEVDLKYLASVHDMHSDLPFCPTREKPPGAKHDTKLLATLYDKKRYVIHYRNLQLCTCHGLRVTKVYRALRFTQSAWLRDYIELNTRHRTRATNDFKKNLFKLMNNAVFGKTMENVRNRVDVRLLSQWDGRVCRTQKMYAIKVDGKSDTKKAKGVKSGVVARTITFDDYVKCLENEIAMTRDQSCVRSKLHQVYTVSETKIALSPYDDKRYLEPDSTNTLPWGHYRIPL